VFGSLFLKLDAGGAHLGGVPAVSGHALFVTMAWIAVTLTCGAVAAVSLARIVRASAVK
jgi:hypothetical protein